MRRELQLVHENRDLELALLRLYFEAKESYIRKDSRSLYQLAKVIIAVQDRGQRRLNAVLAKAGEENEQLAGQS